MAATPKTEKERGTPVHSELSPRLNQLLTMGAALVGESKSEFIRTAIAERCDSLSIDEMLKSVEAAQRLKAKGSAAAKSTAA